MGGLCWCKRGTELLCNETCGNLGCVSVSPTPQKVKFVSAIAHSVKQKPGRQLRFRAVCVTNVRE